MVRGMASAKRAVEGGLRFIRPAARVLPLVFPILLLFPLRRPPSCAVRYVLFLFSSAF